LRSVSGALFDDSNPFIGALLEANVPISFKFLDTPDLLDIDGRARLYASEK
jgi:hypothetical protein